MLHTLKVCFIVSGCWFGLLVNKAASAQTLPEKLSAFLQKHSAEIIYLATDKPYYLAGDTIFFRVSNAQPVSDNLMEVQLIAPQANHTKLTKLLLTNGFQVSYLVLPKDAVNGDYVVRAFSPIGWEASALVSVYNPNQETAEYQVCNWLNSELGPRFSLTKQANAWEIAWKLNQPLADSKAWLLIIGANQVYYSIEVDLSVAENKVSAPINAFPTNQAQVILATSTGEIISNYTYTATENPNDQLQLSLNKDVYVNREPVELQISDKPTGSNNGLMTIRVLEQTDTLNNALLNIDNQQNNYFLKKSFPQLNFKKIISATAQGNNYDFILKGKLVSTLDKKPVANNLIHLLVPATNQMEVLYADKEGRIQVELDFFEEIKPIVFRAIQEEEEIKNISFVPDSSQLELPGYLAYQAKPLSLKQQQLVARLKILNQINQAFLSGLEPEDNNRNNYYRPTAFAESKLKPTTSYDLSKYEKFSNVTEIFRELVPAVEVVKRKDGMRARLYARLLKRFYTYYPLFLIDGIPTYDVETVLNIPADQLVKIDVFNTSTALAPFDVLSTGGVIALYTQNRNFNPALLHDNVPEFPGTAPAYAMPRTKNMEPTIPDFDPLVYWNPQVKSESNKVINLTFPTNDQVGRFIIEVTSLNNQGEEITSYKSFVVEAGK